MTLTDKDRRLLDQARELADLNGIDAICERASETDPAAALAVVFGEAQAVLTELAIVAYRLAERSTAS